MVPEISAPPALEAYRCELDGEEFVLFEWDAPRKIDDRSRLSVAESHVLDLVLAGRSNAEIAAARRRSPRTVANQIAALFGKLGVRSRAELFALAAGRRVNEDG